MCSQLIFCIFYCIYILQILCIHIKRFHQLYDDCRKLTDYVEFPLYDLDMSAYLHYGI